MLAWFAEVVERAEGVHLRRLPPFTTLMVLTMNSLYQVVVIDGSDVYVQGGAHFPDPTPATLVGSTIGGSCLSLGWVGVGLRAEIHAAGRRVVTSAVRAIRTVQAPGSVRH
jgi:hypothetical protein